MSILEGLRLSYQIESFLYLYLVLLFEKLENCLLSFQLNFRGSVTGSMLLGMAIECNGDSNE